MKTTIHLAGVCATVAVMILLITSSLRRGEAGFTLEYNITGGFWGRNDGITLDSGGDAVYRVRGNTVRSAKLPQQVLSGLTSRLEKLLSSHPNGLKLEPEGGADYSTYSLVVRRGGRTLTYMWTDLSKVPPELSHLHALLQAITASLSSELNILIFIDVGEPVANVGSTRRIRVTVFNLMPEDFNYISPTPCHPDARVLLHREGVEPVEVYPAGFDPSMPCIQVLEKRVLKATASISFEYDLHLSEAGDYVIEAHFPYMEAEGRRFAAWTRLTVKG
ncbi:MAG: hypothetical protein QW517_09685 [Thermofilaceae archaeon]